MSAIHHFSSYLTRTAVSMLAVLALAGMPLTLGACGPKQEDFYYFDDQEAIPLSEQEKVRQSPDDVGPDDVSKTILLTHSQSERGPVQEAALVFKDYLESHSDYHMEVYPDNTLGSISGSVSAVINGTVDMRLGSGGSRTLALLSSMPYYSDLSWDKLSRELAEGGALYGMIEREYLERGLVLLGVLTPDYRYMTTNKKVNGIEDLKGQVIRVTSDTDKLYLEPLGVESIRKYEAEELYTALQMGVIDGQENSLQVICSRKLYEQQQYFIHSPMRLQFNTFFINLYRWNGLSIEEKDVFRAAAREAVEKGNKILADANDEFMGLIKKNMIVVNFTEEERRTLRDTAGAVIREHVEEVFGEELVQKVIGLVS